MSKRWLAFAAATSLVACLELDSGDESVGDAGGGDASAADTATVRDAKTGSDTGTD